MIEKGLHIINNFSDWLLTHGVEPDMVHYIRLLILIVALSIILFIVDIVAKKIIVGSITKVLVKSKNKWDDVLLEKGIFSQLAHLFPAIVVNWSTPFVFSDFTTWIPTINKLVDGYMIIVVVMFLTSFFNALEHFFANSKKFKDKPIESYFQLAKLISYFIAGIFILSLALGKSPIYLLGAFGAVSAVLLLIFKDTILGFVASIQIATNDMVRVNDWVEMSKYGADGNVIKITLNTVKVRNWDNTITTIPTYALVSDSFKNWRGMQEVGARRIKRHLYIRPKSIRFANAEMLEKFKSFQLVETYLTERQQEIETNNTTIKADKTEVINGRNLTNIGVFREYTERYLQSHNEINPNMTLMVRQLQSNQYGLPLEIYCFAKTTNWEAYEGIQSDIMDHLFAASESFGLEIYELSATV